MSEKQPPSATKGATTGDVDTDVAPVAASAEDRKAASALANLDAADDASTSSSKQIDQEAVSKAMKNLGGAGTASGKPASGGAGAASAAPKKNVKVDAADVALLVEELDMTKPRATDFLKGHDGDLEKALRAYVTPAQ